MTPSLRTVNRIPLERLWNEDGEIEVSRKCWVSTQALRAMLRMGQVQFIVADIGSPLRRIDMAKCFDFWKSEVEHHLIDDPGLGFSLDDFPGGYAYLASEWTGNHPASIVLLEKHH